MFALRTAPALSLVTCLSLTGCLVSFEDYPLSALGRGGASTSTSGSDAGGEAAGASGPGGSAAGDLALGGSATGGTATGGSAAGGDAAGGSATGGDNSAGSAGSGGVPAGGSATGGTGGSSTPPSELLIDDFEDGDSQVALVAGRNGSWFVSNDGTAQQAPAPAAPTLPSLLAPPRGASTRALHTTGAGFTTWGAMVGANFVVTGATAMPYDISSHQGLTFTAKIGKLTSVKQVRVSIRNYDTLYACTTCGDHFGATATMGDTFTTIQVPFSSFKQQGWGRPLVPSFATNKTYAFTFVWAAHQTFDVWIDDVAFY
jgi:hypothetical protein